MVEGIRRNFSLEAGVEWTMEVNPGTATEEKAIVWKEAGINRISMGVQSLNDSLLKRLGRIHTADQARTQFFMLRDKGFKNISVDLMLGLPDQDISQWEETVKEVVSWGPEHISCYSLIVEEGTPFYEQYERGTLSLPEEEEERAMYHWAVPYLAQQGYGQYEISNFAREGFESRHNIGYWERIPYLGIGLGAASLIQDGQRQIRYKNTGNLQQYIKESGRPDQIRQEVQILSQQECMEEFMFLGLRKTRGISGQEFYRNFGIHLEEKYGTVIHTLMEEELLQKEEDRYYLSFRGMDLGNQVFAAFLN